MPIYDKQISILGIITGGIATDSWMGRRWGSLIRATLPGATRKHRGSPRFGLCQQNRRGISTSPCRSLPITVYRDNGKRISVPIYDKQISILGIITGGIATDSWMGRRWGSLIRATLPGATRKHRGSPRFGLCQQNRRGISTSPCRSLCPSPRHLLYPSPLRQLPHRQKHYRHRLHQCRTLRALAAN